MKAQSRFDATLSNVQQQVDAKTRAARERLSVGGGR